MLPSASCALTRRRKLRLQSGRSSTRLWGGGKMAQPIQIILTRRLAEYLSVPLFLVGPNGDLLFYNEPAEAILGRRFDETGAMSAKEWSAAFTPEDSEGHAVPPEDVPLMITITKKTARPPAFLHPGSGRCPQTCRGRINYDCWARRRLLRWGG